MTFEYKINEGFLWSEVNLKGEKKYYIEGYASTIDRDKAGEVINLEAQQDLLTQLNNENITLDIEHEEWYDEAGNVLPRPKNEKIPVARITSAELREKGVWVKAEINRNIPSFRSVWNSIKEGFLKAFSIAFYPVKKAGDEISKLNLVNITLTGSPVNPHATFNAVMKSAAATIKNDMEEKKLVEETVKPDVKAEEPVEEEQVVANPEPAAEEEEVVEAPAEPTVEEPEVKAESNEELESLKAEIKALKQAQEALIKKLEEPVMKAVKEEAPEVPVKEQIYVSPLKLI